MTVQIFVTFKPCTTYILKATRKALILHIISNIPKRIHEDVLPTDDISYHDILHILLNVLNEIKHIRDNENCDMEAFIKNLSRAIVGYLLLLWWSRGQARYPESSQTHTPLKSVKLTDQIAPWMNDPEITQSRIPSKAQNTYVDRALCEDYKQHTKHYKKVLKSKNTILWSTPSDRENP